MLELLRLLASPVFSRAIFLGFNPYCVGIIALTELTEGGNVDTDMFQSLLCWNYCAYKIYWCMIMYLK